MAKLSTLEKIIHAGDLKQLRLFLNELTITTDLDKVYDAAQMLSTYGFLNEANELYEVLLVHLPNEGQLKIDRANILIELGEEDEALLLLKEIKKEEDAYAQSLLVQADYYHMIGLAETALNKIKEAYELYPNEPIIQFAYAELLLDAGRYAEAARFYAGLKNEAPYIGEVNILERLAEAYSAGGAYEEAIPYYDALLAEGQTLERLFNGAFAYYQTGKAQRAIQLLEQLLAMDPDYYSAYMLIGQAHLLLEENKKALKWFKAGIARDEYDKELYLSAGKCALKLGLQKEAEGYLSEALTLDPEYIEALVSLASLYHELQEDELLINLMKDHTEIEGIATLQAFLAYAYERMELYKDAYDAFKKAYDGMKEDYDFLNAYASFLIEEGKREEAVAVATELIRRFPEDHNWTLFLEEYDREV